MRLKEINSEVIRHNSTIVLSYICDDGSYIKEKYIGYKLSEAKKLFRDKYKAVK